MNIRRISGACAAVCLATALAACGGTDSGSSSADAAGGDRSVTVYSADGLGDWYQPQFAAFTQSTGIKVDYVEAGSSEVVSRIAKEKSNPQADVLVTLPPFIQQVDKDGLLGDLGVDTGPVPAADKAKNNHWTAVVNNYSCFIVNDKVATPPKTWEDLLKPEFKGKLQYSTPGQAGDGTAVLVLLQHELGKDGARAYLKKLQANNVGPSSSTGKLQPKVSSGALSVANGDVQMNLTSVAADKSAFKVFFPADGTKQPETVALPYDIGLTSNAPHADNGKKLIGFLLGTGAQQAVSATAYGIPVRSDVTPTDANFTAVQQAVQGVQVYHPEWDTVLSELDADVAAYNSAVGS